MSGPEERQRAVDLCSATPMTTAQVVEHLGHPTRQCLERWPAKDSQYAGHMDRPIIPLETRTKTIEPVPGGMRGSGPPNGSARASARSATGSGRIERAVWPRCGPKTGTPARPTSQRCDGIGMPVTPRPRDAGSRSRNWGNAVMREVAEAFASSKGRYGYRRIMAEDGLTAHVPERRGYGYTRARPRRLPATSPTGCSSGPRRRRRRERIPWCIPTAAATAGSPDGWRSWTATA